MKTSILLPISLAIVISGCTKNSMPPYDGSNPNEYNKLNCLNKPQEIQNSESCQKARHDISMRAITKEPS